MQVNIGATDEGIVVEVFGEDRGYDRDVLPWASILTYLDRERRKENRVKMNATKQKGCM